MSTLQYTTNHTCPDGVWNNIGNSANGKVYFKTNKVKADSKKGRKGFFYRKAFKLNNIVA